MNEAIKAMIISLRDALDDTEMYLGPPATLDDIAMFAKIVRSELGESLPIAYLDFLRNFDGLVACGVFIYSCSACADGKKVCHDFLQMNMYGRDVNFMSDFLVFGDSDMDEYVLDLVQGKYQVRDRQAFDNVYEEFETFDGLLEHMVKLVAHWAKG